MTLLALFRSDTRASLKERTAVVVAALALCGVGAASGLDRLTRDGGLPRIAIIPASSNFAQELESESPAADPAVASTTLDPDPVGSIPEKLSRPIILNPCNGREN